MVLQPDDFAAPTNGTYITTFLADTIGQHLFERLFKFNQLREQEVLDLVQPFFLVVGEKFGVIGTQAAVPTVPTNTENLGSSIRIQDLDGGTTETRPTALVMIDGDVRKRTFT